MPVVIVEVRAMCNRSDVRMRRRFYCDTDLKYFVTNIGNFMSMYKEIIIQCKAE